ncbi:hypothetical protein ACQZ48_20655 [Agrobacterium sp. 22-209-1]
MAADCRIVPQLAFRTSNTFLVQRLGNGAGTDSVREFAEDAPDDFGLLFIDLPVAASEFAASIQLLHDPVAVAKPAA